MCGPPVTGRAGLVSTARGTAAAVIFEWPGKSSCRSPCSALDKRWLPQALPTNQATIQIIDAGPVPGRCAAAGAIGGEPDSRFTVRTFEASSPAKPFIHPDGGGHWPLVEALECHQVRARPPTFAPRQKLDSRGEL